MQERILRFPTTRDFNSVIVFKAAEPGEGRKYAYPKDHPISDLGILLRDNLTSEQLKLLVAHLSIVTDNNAVPVTDYEHKASFKPGQYVTCVRTGAAYSTHVEWVMTYKPIEYVYRNGKSPETDERYQVVCCGPHGKYPVMLYGIVNEEGQFFVIGENGIELADE